MVVKAEIANEAAAVPQPPQYKSFNDQQALS
jgi:hypothetical protein